MKKILCLILGHDWYELYGGGMALRCWRCDTCAYSEDGEPVEIGFYGLDLGGRVFRPLRQKYQLWQYERQEHRNGPPF